MDDLVTWLTAQVAKDERGALATDSSPSHRYEWEVRETSPLKLPSVYVANSIYVLADEVHDEAAEHIAAWDPERVLAECDSKRRIIIRHRPTDADGYKEGRPLCVECDNTYWPCRTLVLIASPYAGRPGYRPDWAPLDTP